MEIGGNSASERMRCDVFSCEYEKVWKAVEYGSERKGGMRRPFYSLRNSRLESSDKPWLGFVWFCDARNKNDACQRIRDEIFHGRHIQRKAEAWAGQPNTFLSISTTPSHFGPRDPRQAASLVANHGQECHYRVDSAHLLDHSPGTRLTKSRKIEHVLGSTSTR